MISLTIGGTDYSSRVVSCSVSKKGGTFAPSSASFQLDNSDDYFTTSTLPTRGVAVVISLDGTTTFTGKVETPELNLVERAVLFTAADLAEELFKKKCTPALFVGKTPNEILTALMADAGVSSYSLDNPALTTAYFWVDETMTIGQVISEICISTAGHAYITETGTFTYKTGIEGTFSTSTAATIGHPEIIEITRTWNPDMPEETSCRVTGRKIRLLDTLEEVFEGTSETNHILVPTGGLGVSGDYYVDLDDPVWYLGDWSSVEFTGSGGITLDQTTYEANFSTGNTPKSPTKIKLKVTNSSGAQQEISELTLWGKKARAADYIAKCGTTEEVYEITSDLVTDLTWAGKLAQYEKERVANKHAVKLETLFDTGLGLHVRDKVHITDPTNGTTGRYVVTGIELSYPNLYCLLALEPDRAAAFSYDSGQIDFSETERAAEWINVVGDGLDPNAPTSLVLSTTQTDYKSILNVSWTASTSTDISRYVVEFKPQGTVWGNASSVEVRGLSTALEVEELTWYDLRVKAIDVEDKESAWLTGSKMSQAISGNGAAPPNFGFDDSECSAAILNGKRYAHLVWRNLGSAVSDIKRFLIRYSNESDANDFAISRSTSGLWCEPTQERQVEVPGNQLETYIEIPSMDTWNFKLFVEDYDGYVRNYYSGGGDDGFLQLNFSGTPFSESTPNTATLATQATGDNYLIWRVTAPSNARPEWEMIFQQKQANEDWDLAEEYSFLGNETFQFSASGIFYVKIWVKPASKDRTYKARVRFKNRDAELGTWSSEVSQVVSAALSAGGPAAVTGFSLSTEQPSGEYISQITASWTESTGPDLAYYELEIKKVGEPWSAAKLQTVRGETTYTETVDEYTDYAIRVRAVDSNELASDWVGDTIRSAVINGDGSMPPRWRFVDASCTALVTADKRFAKLRIQAVDAAEDIKAIYVGYGPQIGTWTSYKAWPDSTTSSYGVPAGYSKVEVNQEDEYVYIEVDRTTYTFFLIVADHDERERIYVNPSDGTGDGFYTRSFASNYILSSSAPSAPTIDEDTTSYTGQALVSATTPASVSNADAIEIQYSEISEDWPETSQIILTGDLIDLQASTEYWIAQKFDAVEEAKMHKWRARMANTKDSLYSAWSATTFTGQAATSYTLSQPGTISRSDVSAGGRTAWYFSWSGTLANDFENFSWALNKAASSSGPWETEVASGTTRQNYLYTQPYPPSGFGSYFQMSIKHTAFGNESSARTYVWYQS